MAQTTILGEIQALCRAHPDADVLLDNAHRNVGLVPLTTVLTVGRRVSPFLHESIYLFMFSDAQPPMRAGALAALITNPSLPISLHRCGDLLDYETMVRELGHFRLYSVRRDDETIVIDCIPPSPLRAFMKLATEHPDATVVYRDPYADADDPEDQQFRPITTVDGHPVYDTEPTEPNHVLTLHANPEKAPLPASEILRLVAAEMEGRRLEWTMLEASYPLTEDEQQDGIYDSFDDIETVTLHEGQILLTAHSQPMQTLEPIQIIPPVEVGDIVVGGPGWAWGQRLGSFVYVSDDAEQHREFKFEAPSVQGWANQQETLLLSGVRSLYKPTPTEHAAYDATRCEARFWVQAVHLFRQGRVTHLEGVPHIFEPGDALLVEAVRLNTMGAVDTDAERIRFVQAGLYDGDQYAMRARPKRVGSVYSNDEKAR